MGGSKKQEESFSKNIPDSVKAQPLDAAWLRCTLFICWAQALNVTVRLYDVQYTGSDMGGIILFISICVLLFRF